MQVMAHRGGMGIAPENSLRAFEQAVSLGVDWIELDVRLSKDGELIVIHDPDLERLTGDKKLVSECTMAEITSMKTLSGEPITTLEEALRVIGSKTKVNIEIKDTAPAPVLAEFLKKRLQKTAPRNQFMVSSFSMKGICTFHSLLPTVPTAKLRRWWPFMNKAQISKTGARYVGLRKNWAIKPIIDRLHGQNLKVYSYTIDDPVRLRRLDSIGLDMVVRNFPD